MGYAGGRIDEYFNDRLDCRGARLLHRSRVADATTMACGATKLGKDGYIFFSLFLLFLKNSVAGGSLRRRLKVEYIRGFLTDSKPLLTFLTTLSRW